MAGTPNRYCQMPFCLSVGVGGASKAHPFFVLATRANRRSLSRMGFAADLAVQYNIDLCQKSCVVARYPCADLTVTRALGSGRSKKFH